ncbi:glycosyltransferase family 4 protein [Microbacterium sp. zg.Y1090]|uniref:glycosyltransferase n=1 Tax=Microbacterium wangruii TaxID=3049073 RepID=UPI00214C9828|nr:MULTISPECIES: glycosyltransferase family 4 protein [unclassified Microbacterium]MCR2817869.1 glycosyltransferase family 4 protein [Microbacterium sp. zg.Y1090]WIM27961.1 glycosyltransferase family 4 protein [Microbacterium sp. zg-Y1090]
MQIYEVVRTAHLERAVELGEGVTILYRGRRYDFDADVARGVDVLRRGLLASTRHALTHRVDVIEVNEPLVVRAATRSLAFIVAARLRARVVGDPRPVAVAYAIGNMPTAQMLRNLPLKAGARHRLQRLLAPAVWRALDRVAFGTSQAAQLYGEELSGRRDPETELIEALPTRDPEATGDPRPETLAFVGDLSERKGFPALLAAWPAVRASVPGARLVIVGRGAGEDDARRLADADPQVSLLIDPPREEIYRALRGAKVLTLPSRRRPLWREQVGLPIAEALAQGCAVVTTDETGIARWLRDHGHHVVPEEAVERELSAELVAALTSRRTPEDVWSDLPSRDGRESARAWMYADGEEEQP